jgi:preprotein translocase subunit Sec63
MNPFHMLGVGENTGNEEIRRAYLDAIKAAPPERDAERFAELTRAYESIKDERARYEYILFNQDCPGDSPLDALVRWARVRGGVPRPLPSDAMKDFLRKCNKR